MNLMDFFDKHPAFTREELKQYVEKHQSENPNTLKQLINYHLNQENIGQVKRGLFYIVKRGYSADDTPVDEMIIAGKMRDDAVLAYHTALDLFGRAHSVFNVFYFLTQKAKNTRTVEFRGSTYKPVQVPKALLVKEKEHIGIKPYDRKGLTISVTSLERTLVDILDRPKLGGGWEEIWRSTTGFGFLKMEELLEYSLALGKKKTVAKVGFFLEQHREEYRVKEKYLEELEKHRPKQPQYMDRNYEEGTLVSRWSLIVPDYILNREWEEF